MKPYQWLLFDADGTLFDYDQAEASALEGTFGDLALPFTPQTSVEYRKINHQIWVDFEQGLINAEELRVRRFERLFEVVHLEGSPSAFSSRYLINLSRQAHLMPAAEETLAALKPHYHMALITNGLKDVQRPRLALSAIAPYFGQVFISEEVGAVKPEPAYFEAVFQAIRMPEKKDVLVIGDSLSSDIQGGLNYGLDTCWYNPAGKPASLPVTYNIRSLVELIQLLLT